MAAAAKNNGEKILSLSKHLQALKNRLDGKQVGHKQQGKAIAYFEWLNIEIKRTEKSIENLKVG